MNTAQTTNRDGRAVHTSALPLACSFLLLAATGLPAANLVISGRVRALTENGDYAGLVPSAQIVFRDPAGGEYLATSNGNGRYELANLPGAGVYYYRITATGYKLEDHGRGAQIERNQGNVKVDLWLTKGETDPNFRPTDLPKKQLGTLEGLVYEMTPQGKRPVPGAAISLRKQGSLDLMKLQAGTAASRGEPVAGRYAVDLEEGTWQVSAAHPDYETLVDPKPVAIRGPGPDSEPQIVRRDFRLVRRRPASAVDQGIRGRVHLADPSVAAAPIRLRVGPLSGKATPVSVRGDGSFARQLEPGVYAVVAEADGYQIRSCTAAVLEGEYTRLNLTLPPVKADDDPPADLPPEPTPDPTRLLVTVQTEESRPAGALVVVDAACQDGLLPERTDESGRARFKLPGPGTYRVVASLPDHEDSVGEIEAVAGRENRLSLMLKPIARPTVWTAHVKGKQQDGSTIDLAGATVWLKPSGQHLKDGLKRTTENGKDAGRARFELSPETTGAFLAIAVMEDYDSAVAPVTLAEGANGVTEIVLVTKLPEEPVKIEQSTGGERDPLEMLPPKPTRKLQVWGYVKRAQPGGRGYYGVEGARLRWVSLGGGLQPDILHESATLRDGKYSFQLHAGPYRCNINLPEGYRLRSGEAAKLSSIAVNSTVRLDILVERIERAPPVAKKPPLVRLRGYVVRDGNAPQQGGYVTRNGYIRGGNFYAVHGARVTLSNASRRVWITTDSEGKFEFSNLRPGMYSAAVSPPNYSYRGLEGESVSVHTEVVRDGMGELAESNRPVFVLAMAPQQPAQPRPPRGPEVTGPSHPPRSQSSLTVKVFDGNRIPATLAAVTARGPSGSRSAVTLLGSAHLPALAPGHYQVNVTLGGHVAQRFSVYVEGGSSRTVYLQKMPQTGPPHSTVRPPGGNPNKPPVSPPNPGDAYRKKWWQKPTPEGVMVAPRVR